MLRKMQLLLAAVSKAHIFLLLLSLSWLPCAQCCPSPFEVQFLPLFPLLLLVFTAFAPPGHPDHALCQEHNFLGLSLLGCYPALPLLFPLSPLCFSGICRCGNESGRGS